MKAILNCFFICLISGAASFMKAEDESPLPQFGRYTVLVWTEHIQDYESQFVEINNAMQDLPVIKVTDDRDAERWFLDDEQNPLLVKHKVREYVKILASITTNRSNTLRWIKGDKPQNPPD
jgi:hypothetical protein